MNAASRNSTPRAKGRQTWSRMKSLRLALAAFVCLAACLAAGRGVARPQDERPRDARRYEALAVEAYKAKDYAKGVFDSQTKRYTPLAPAPDSTMLGIDGLYFYRGGLVAVQNGVSPQRVVRLFLSADATSIERFETVAANDPVFDEPTLGVLVKDRFYFIANSQWGAVDEQGRLAPPEKLKEPVVLKLRL